MWEVPKKAGLVRGQAGTGTGEGGGQPSRPLSRQATTGPGFFGSTKAAARSDPFSPRVQFSTSTTVHSLAINFDGSKLAVGTSEHTEVYAVWSTQVRLPRHPMQL